MMLGSIEKLSSYITQKLSENEFEDCLIQLKEFVENIININILDGLLIDIPGLDNLCLEVGQKILSEYSIGNSNKTGLIVYVATQLYRSGGHTAVIEDFIRAQLDKRHIILLTDIFNTGEEGDIKKRFEKLPVELIFSPTNNSLRERLVWLYKKWIEISPEKVFLFNHHQDVVAIAAAQPQMPGQLFYYHHTDFQLGLGIRLKHAKHIDMNPLAYSHCRDKFGLDNVYCPLTCVDVKSEKPKSRNYMQEGKINTASSGSCQKFMQDYLYLYFDLLPQIMETTGGKHMHLGYLPRKILNLIRQKLSFANISQERFVYVPWVKSVGITMIEQDIDLYISSFPVGGGRTAIEVMASATPILGHLNYRSGFLSENNLLYPEAFIWKTPVELKQILGKLTSQILMSHAKLAREHYLECYSHELLQKSISSDFQAVAPQKLKTQISNGTDFTQLFLDISIKINNLQRFKNNFLFFKKAKNVIKKVLILFRRNLNIIINSVRN